MKWLALKWLARGVFALAILAAAALYAFSWLAERREVADARQAAPPGGRYVKAADVELFVQETGPAAGVPVVFVHGTGAWSEAWRGAMAAAAKAGARAIALDLPPFGFSQRPQAPRYAKLDQGRRIAGLLEALDLKGAILVGHSFGGGPTTEAALLAPDRVRALVLVDAALSIGSDQAQSAAAPPLVESLLGLQPLRDSLVATFLTNPLLTRKLLEAFIDNPVHATNDWVRLYQRPLVVRGTTPAVGEWLPALLAPGTVAASERPASWRGLKIPLFVIWGDKDTITPLSQARRLVSLVPGAQLTVLPDVGHIPQIEDPDGFHRALLAAIAKASAK
jgi:pimeloyl-ACP methyl ester carboxylesterase